MNIIESMISTKIEINKLQKQQQKYPDCELISLRIELLEAYMDYLKCIS